jgi:hypothetical protein
MRSRYLPTLPQVSAETISILCATIVAALIIARVPAIQKLVQDNSLTLRIG